ncbi:hypothetical protein HUT03_00230 [Candidatus Liberibacter africanus]|uniref:Uncharacterized protein n=1 Tax=Candidatus Liberibacter africanus PTSAPSY TaxID=1277257 RepID=A0A0G3I395_LIBAF|nr:hypothetical protein [Candidatus Liberibacter africanus]AKK19705.1 hypothetical protein G293_00240 [Candidatus Liberibacter africanus PTSAPSY]QTP63589.1 hypothetical protein HUT03_00230 [Candidatus Liberibacter africanus]
MKHKKKKSIGRPCKKGVSRTDSGRISRSKKAKFSPEKTAQEARMRIFGLSAFQAAQAESGNRVGRLRLTGKISSEQYQAFIRFSHQYHQYMNMIQAPNSLQRSGEQRNTSIYNEDADTKRRLSIKKRWMSLKQAINEAQEKSSYSLWKSLEYFLKRDDGIAYATPLSLIVSLSYATDILVHHYGITSNT